MIFAALEPVLRSTPRTWRVLPLRRALLLREEINSSGTMPMLSLHSNGDVSPRDKTNQPPSPHYALRYAIVRPGDLVVNPMWLAGGGIGVTRVLGAVSPDYRVYKPSSLIEPRYLHYLLRSRPYLAQYRLLMRAETTFDRRVTKTDFGQLPLIVPPLRTQLVIVDFLDAQAAHNDELVAKKSRMGELLRERWRSAVSNVMADLGKRFGFIALRRLVHCLDGRRVPLSSEERSTRSGQFPYYGASGIVDYIDDYLFEETLVLLGEDGAQLGDPNYDIPQVATGRYWVNNHAHVLQPTLADPEFLALHLNTFDRLPFISGATREKITQGDMGQIPVPHVDRVTQVRVRERLSLIKKNADDATDRLDRQIALLREHREALITAAATGALGISGAAA
jgi:type I restriction enzyme, S subunit